MEEKRIRHMVIFSLKGDKNSPESEKFLQDGKSILSSIPVVEKFELLNQISSKNEYDFGFSMEFPNEEAYEIYNLHPLHIDFVNQRWKKEVIKFLEIDFNNL